MSSKISLYHYSTGHLGLRNETKVVLFFITISALLGFTQVPIQYAEGAVSWNGFLKQVGFDPPTVYEVTGVTVIPGSTNAEVKGDTLQLRCQDGDWLAVAGPPFSMTAEPLADIVANDLLINTVSITQGITESPKRNISSTKTIGFDVTPNRNEGQQPNEVFDITVTVKILCLSPSSFQTVGGEWQATDTTALIIGYSVLNAYWLAPIGIGIGVGIYLVKRKF